MPVFLQHTSVKFLIGLIAGVAVVAGFTLTKDSSFLRGQTAGSCGYCQTSIGNCVLESSNVGQCAGSARWDSYMSCSAGDPPCSNPGPTPPPPTIRYTYGSCGSTCYQVAVGGWATQGECETAKANACPTAAQCQSIGCTCSNYNSNWQCPTMDPMNPPQAPYSSCQGSYCNVCTDANPAVPQCTWQGNQGMAPNNVGPGQTCGWLWDNVMGSQCCTGTNWGALYPTMCDSTNGYKCYDSTGVELTWAASPGQTGTCKTLPETLPQCVLMDDASTPYNGEIIPVGGICQLSTMSSCAYTPSSGGGPVQGTGYAQCEGNSTCTNPPGGGPMRCVAQACNSGWFTLCSDTPTIASGPGQMCGDNAMPCCTSTGVPDQQDVVCNTSMGYECVNGMCDIPRYATSCISGNVACEPTLSPVGPGIYATMNECQNALVHGSFEYMCTCRVQDQTCVGTVAGCCNGLTCDTNGDGKCHPGASSVSSRSSSLSSRSSSYSSMSSSAPSVCCLSNLPADAGICRSIPPPAPF